MREIELGSHIRKEHMAAAEKALHKKAVQTFKADFHCHVKLIPFWKYRLPQLLQRLRYARASGLDIQAVTEHADVEDFWEIIASIEDLNSMVAKKPHDSGGHGLVILPGVEVPIREEGDIVLVGSTPGLMEMERRLGRITLDKKPAFLDLMDATEDLGFLRIGAHPSRKRQVLWKLGDGLYRLDALEINSRELHSEEEVKRRAHEMGIPVVSGSDAHVLSRVGAMYNVLPVECPVKCKEPTDKTPFNWPLTIKDLLKKRQVLYKKRTPDESLLALFKFLTGL